MGNVSWIVIAMCLVVSASVPQDITNARRRANEHLSYLRTGNWEKAADLVVVITYLNSSHVQIPLDVPSRPERSRLRSQAIELLRRVYGAVKPGEIQGSGELVRGDHLSEPERSRIGKRVRFSYRHDDLDGLEMLWVGGKWYRYRDVRLTAPVLVRDSLARRPGHNQSSPKGLGYERRALSYDLYDTQTKAWLRQDGGS